jgi:hypothetical protein
MRVRFKQPIDLSKIMLLPGVTLIDRSDGASALKGFNPSDFIGLLLMAIVFAAIALLFQRRDIRIAGEGSRHLPF